MALAVLAARPFSPRPRICLFGVCFATAPVDVIHVQCKRLFTLRRSQGKWKREISDLLLSRSLRCIRREEKESDIASAFDRISYVSTDLAALTASHEINEMSFPQHRAR